MPNGTVKLYHTDRKFGFITAEDGTEVFVSEAHLAGTTIKAGDRISFEIAEGDNGTHATSIEVQAASPLANPNGRTLAAPPDWFSIEDRERARRRNRRRR